MCSIPVSLGELYDKYTILEIKSERVSDKTKLIEVHRELTYLKPYIGKKHSIIRVSCFITPLHI